MKNFFIVLLVLIVVGAGYYIYLSKTTFVSENNKNELPVYVPTTKIIRCGEGSGTCLFDVGGDTDIAGVGKLEGYYNQITKARYGDGEYVGDVKCDVLVVSGGDQELVDYFSNMVARGNSVNRKDGAGQLLFNLNLADVNEYDKKIILNSTKESPVKLTFLREVIIGRGVDSCHSFMTILKVN